MAKFIVKRILMGIFVLLGTSILIFTIARVVPGDVASIALGSRASEAAKEALRQEMIDYRTAKQNVDKILGIAPEEPLQQKEISPER